jgi:hypothetical protein
MQYAYSIATGKSNFAVRQNVCSMHIVSVEAICEKLAETSPEFFLPSVTYTTRILH